MRLLKASFEVETPYEEIARTNTILEKIGRTCYKSENKITSSSADAFIEMLVEKGHWAMLEHRSVSIRFICDRGVSHEIVRHRVASYAQESTRYCDYSKSKFDGSIAVINMKDVMAMEVGKVHDGAMITLEHATEWLHIWTSAIRDAEEAYIKLRKAHCPAQLARSVLPNSLKTEIVVTMNLREWYHFFTLRTAAAAHPQMQELTIPLLRRFQEWFPMIYGGVLSPGGDHALRNH